MARAAATLGRQPSAKAKRVRVTANQEKEDNKFSLAAPAGVDPRSAPGMQKIAFGGLIAFGQQWDVKRSLHKEG
jgi:hypothetical protein